MRLLVQHRPEVLEHMGFGLRNLVVSPCCNALARLITPAVGKRSQVDAVSLAITLIFHPSPTVNKKTHDSESGSPPAQHPSSPCKHTEQGEEHPSLTVPFTVQQATDLCPNTNSP